MKTLLTIFLLTSVYAKGQTDTTGRKPMATKFYYREMFGTAQADTTFIKRGDENPYYKVGDTVIFFHHVYGWKPNHKDSIYNHLIFPEYDKRFN